MIEALITKQKMKQILQKSRHFISSSALLVILLVFATSSTFFQQQLTHAQSIQEQINTLEQQNEHYQNQVDQLQNQATSYKDAIEKLQAKISALQGKINANAAEQARLKKEIAKAEAELKKQRNLLGQNIRAMYLEGDISTLEMLASSNDLSEFLNKQQYRSAVEDKITQTLTRINKLKLQLKEQSAQIEALLKKQQAQQAELTASHSEQANLLSFNESQQAKYNERTRNNQAKIDDLIAQQRQANFNPDGGYYFLRFPGTVKDFNPNNYPYRNAGFGMSPGPGCVDNDGPDAWGYCTRQCVSYAAWAVLASGRSAPMYYGNARDWVAEAYARGIPVYRNPQPGDVAISTSGFWGHAMYVESVSGNSFNTSEYNTYLTGRLSYQTRSF